ncbi:MAG: DtxR family transcriptional regulator [Ignavibacteria bacterium]|nr:DtxR family transcriptional regulator [Ignavibacteria bacterium]
MLSQAIEDYLKTIHKLEDDGAVATTRIAKELNISGASVTGMLKRLSTMGLVDYNSYKGVRLTDTGTKVALEIIRHHRLLELYLKEKMGYSLEKVHEEACRLEHHISDDFVNKIDDMLGNPEFDPHGHPIPSKAGEMPKSEEPPLSSIDPGQIVIIKRLSDAEPDMLAYFEKMGMIPGAKIKVIDKAPFNGPITIYLETKKNIIGSEIASNIFVEYPVN